MRENVKCILDNGTIVEYSAAYTLQYTGPISDEFVYLGVGYIYSYNDIRYCSAKSYRFYLTKKLRNKTYKC